MADNFRKDTHRSPGANSRDNRDRGRFAVTVPEVDRFWSHVNLDPVGCWLWTNGTTKDGYGRFHLPGGEIRAHRYAYQLLVGPIPDGLTLDHLCERPACVRPGHLEPVTPSENLRRMHERRRHMNGAHLMTLDPETWEQAMACMSCGLAGVTPDEHFPQEPGLYHHPCPDCGALTVWVTEPRPKDITS